MENDVNVQFDKLFIPLIEIKKCVLNLTYEKKKFKFDYPQKEPITIPLSSKFIKDSQYMSLTVLSPEGSKYKKIAKGEINILKKYFLKDKTSIEKWVYLTIFQPQTQIKTHNTDIIKAELNSGKIYMIMTFLHPVELKNQIMKKDPINSNKKEKFRTIGENRNESNKKITTKKESGIIDELFDDIDEVKIDDIDDKISNMTISDVDFNEESRDEVDLTQLANAQDIKILKEKISSDYENILPKDINKLKLINEMLYEKYIELSKNYNDVLKSINEENEQMRIKAKEYYEKYKELKKNFFRERNELRKKKVQLKSGLRKFKEENKSINKEINNYQNEFNFFIKKANIENEGILISKDVDNLTKVLIKLDSLGYDILNCVNLSNEEKEKIRILLKAKEEVAKNEQKNNNQNEYNGEEEQEDIQLGNDIISLIEKDVNDLFQSDLINTVSIDQIDTRNYEFKDVKVTKQVELYITKGKLITNQGEKFYDWLLNNFRRTKK